MTAQLKEFNLEKESLLASGIKDDKRLVQYMQKLEDLHRQFIYAAILPTDLLGKAEALFKWLWIEKPARYKPYGNFRLNDVIDTQLDKESKAVGNCLGLTVFYNCLLKKIGINAGALYLENAFGMRPHVLTLLQAEESIIDIENILPDGFDYKGHLDSPSRIRWGNKELVADIYHSLGNEFYSKGEFTKASENYDMAIRLHPHYEKARINKAILLEKIRNET